MALDEAQLGEILRASPDAVLVVDAEGRIEFASDRVQALFGYSPDELRALSIERLLPQRNRERHARNRDGFFARPETRTMGEGLKLNGLRRDGREFPVDVALSSVGIGEGRRAVCTVRDAAEREKFEDGLRAILHRVEQMALARAAEAKRSDEHLRLFVRHAPAAVAMLDRDMRYLFVSQRWMDDYGLDDRDLSGLSLYDVFPHLPERWREAHRLCLEGVSQAKDEDCFVRPDGRTEWLRWELIPWRDGGGEVGGMMLMTEVITQRKLAEAALIRSHEELEARVEGRTRELQIAKSDAERANTFKSRFLAAAGHDLRQPLQAAIAYLGVLRRQVGDPELAATCDKARAPLESMGEILNALLDAAKLREGNIQPQPVDTSARLLLEQVAASNRPQAEEKGLGFSVEVVDCVLRTDPALLHRALDNLVANAIRYTAAGRVVLRVEPQGDVARICVADTGIGIPAEALDTIFEEYVQLGNPARDRRRGLGLGLSIVKYLTSLLGLSLKVASAEGQGSTFEIEVPLGAPAPAPNLLPAHLQPETPAHAWRVLVVEDDDAVRDSSVMLLKLSGLDPLAAADGEEALARVSEDRPPRVIVSDLRLPGMSGVEVIRRVRAKLGRAVPAVLMTGDTGFSKADLADVPDCTVMYKPVDPDELCNAVVPLCEARA